ncbi:MAG: ArdC-like ssDNA-binding domain-containing protein [Acidimicrobiales bacterium]
MTRTQIPKTTPAERQAKMEQAHADLTAAVESISTGDDWRALLDFSTKFHRYSAGNLAWLMAQATRRGVELTHVGGFGTWLGLGRSVNKGEKGFMVLAPVVRDWSKVDEDEQSGDESTTTAGKRLCGFKVAYVFDESQTSGDDIPEPESICHRLEGAGPEGAWEAVAELVRAAGYELRRESLPGGKNGETNFTTRTVTVDENVSDAQSIKTLLHELAHINCGHEAAISGFTHRGVLEVEAESVAYLVCKEIGLSSESYSCGYVASWAHGDAEIVRKTADKVIKTARSILEELESGASREAVAA